MWGRVIDRVRHGFAASSAVSSAQPFSSSSVAATGIEQRTILIGLKKETPVEQSMESVRFWLAAVPYRHMPSSSAPTERYNFGQGASQFRGIGVSANALGGGFAST